MVHEERWSGRQSWPPKVRHEIRVIRRLLMACSVYYRRYFYEQGLLVEGKEPSFRISWGNLQRFAENPIGVNFGRLMHRLHRYAEQESRRSLAAFRSFSFHRSGIAKISAPMAGA